MTLNVLNSKFIKKVANLSDLLFGNIEEEGFRLASAAEERYCYCLDCDWNNFPNAEHTLWLSELTCGCQKPDKRPSALCSNSQNWSHERRALFFPPKMWWWWSCVWKYMHKQMQCSLKRRRSQKCHFYSFLRCTCNMQLMTLLGFRRNISYFKAPVRCIGRLLFPGRHTNMFLVDDCKNIERLLRSVVLPHRSKESRTLWPKVFRQMFALIQNFARAGL